MSLDRNKPKGLKYAWDGGRNLVLEQRAMQDEYLAGVEMRRGIKLTAKEKEELRYAWLAGCIYGAGFSSNTSGESRRVVGSASDAADGEVKS
jgi:hypothetical protein